jgi:streptomycin 6-kinase
MIRNALNDFPTPIPLSTLLERRLKILAEELPFDAPRIKSWAFCITVLSGAWSFEDHGEVPDLVVEVATGLDEIKIQH